LVIFITENERGQILVEFGLVAPVFVGLVIFLIVLGLWMYNSTQTGQAARIAAHTLAVTGSRGEAEQAAGDYLSKTIIAAKTRRISPYWDGDTACAQVETEMETYFPGLPKLFDRSSPNWTGTVTIIKEAVTASEFQFRPEYQKLFR